MALAQLIRFSKVARKIGRASGLSAERIAGLRKERLRRLLQHAVTAPFFRERYRGLDLDQVELFQLPKTTKDELMANFDQAVTDPAIRRDDVEQFMADRANIGRLYLGRYCVSHTSGSQGQPLVLVQDRSCLEILFATTGVRADPRGNPDLLAGLWRLMRPTKVAVVSMVGFSASGHAFTFFPEVTGHFVRMTRLSPTQPDLVERLNELQPNGIVAYPSILDWLAGQPKRLRLSPPRLRQVSSFGEHLTENARHRIERAFGVPLYDHYGVGECLFLADGCPTGGGAHINADWAILEVVDQAGWPVPPGEPGARVLVTNLANTVQPIIRYEIDDMVTLGSRPCGCGSPLPWIERVEGRSEDVMWIGEQMLTYILFKTAIEYLHQVREWQAVQLEQNKIEIRLELLPGAELDRTTAEPLVLKKLEELGLPTQVKAAVTIVPALSSDPVTGKFNRMVSQIAPPLRDS
jgi:phenylacetate-coenzyme A ligase PaaK-like adenylate-forming protein